MITLKELQSERYILTEYVSANVDTLSFQTAYETLEELENEHEFDWSSHYELVDLKEGKIYSVSLMDDINAN